MQVLVNQFNVRLSREQLESYKRILNYFHVSGGSKSDQFRKLLRILDEWCFDDAFRSGELNEDFSFPEVEI